MPFRQQYKALQEQVIQVPLGGPLDESTDAKLLGSDALTVAQNVRYTKNGQVRKANGWEPKIYKFDATAQALDPISFMASHDEKLLLGGLEQSLTTGGGYTSKNDPEYYYQIGSYDPTRGLFGADGFWTPIVQAKQRTVFGVTDVADPDITVDDEYEYYVWVTSAGVVYSVVERESGAVVVDAVLAIASAVQAKVLNVGGLIIILGRVGATIKSCRIDPSSDVTAITAANNLYPSLHANGTWDACAHDFSGTTPAIFICGKQDAGAAPNHLLCASFDPATWANNGFLAQAIVPVEGIACEQVTDSSGVISGVAIAYREGAVAIRSSLVEDDLSGLVVGPATAITITAVDVVRQLTLSQEWSQAYGSGASEEGWRIWAGMTVQEATVFPLPGGGTTNVREVYSGRLTVGGASRIDEAIHNARLLTRPFEHIGKSHAWVVFESTTQQVAALMTYSFGEVPVAQGAPLITEAHIMSNVAVARDGQPLSNVVVYGTDKFIWAALRNEFGTDYSINANTFDYSQLRFRSVRSDRNLLIGGGQLYCYDGGVQDHGFIHAPEVLDLELNVGGGTLAAGDYYWQFVYEWTDRNGDWHASEPSIPSGPITAAANDSMVFEIKPLVLGDWARNINNVQTVAYRTLVGGSVYYRVPILLGNAADNWKSDFEDIASDANILPETGSQRLGQLLYTTGGVLPNTLSPPSTVVALYQNRVFVRNDTDPLEVWFSKPKAVGVATEFTVLQKLRFDRAVTGLATLGDYLMVFAADRIYAVGGDGPDVTGSGAFQPPRIISLDLGCTNEDSIKATDLGVVFQSGRGIYILSNDGTVQFISDPVRDILATNAILTVLTMPTEHRVLFVLDNPTSASRRLLVFDYNHNRWAEWFNYPNITHAVVHDGLVMWVNSMVDSIYFETGGFVHGTSVVFVNYYMSVATAWLHLANLTGFQRVWFAQVLGEWQAGHDLVVEMYINGDDSAPVQTFTLDAFQTSKTPYLARMKPAMQKNRSVKFVIRDTASGGTHESACWTMLELVCGMKGPHSRNPKARG